MRKIITVLLLLCICVPALASTDMRAVNVGKGDAIIIMTEGKNYLIDTGKANNIGALRRAFEEENISSLDGVFITHTDKDHIGGIEWLVNYSGIEIKQWYFSAYYTDMKPKKHPNNKYELGGAWLKAGDSVEISSNARFDVLAPLAADDSSEDDNSLVMMLTTPDGRILLCGDMEYNEETQLLFSGAELDCDILKVAHHGEDTATSQAFLSASQPEFAVISTSTAEKSNTPSPYVLGLLEGAGCETFITQDASAVRLTLDSGEVTGGYVYLESDYPSVTVSVADRDDEYIVLTNNSDTEADLKDWYLYSEEGREYLLLGDVILAPGGSLAVGTRTTSEHDYDVLWDEKNVISNKQEDNIILYDRDGNPVR